MSVWTARRTTAADAPPSWTSALASVTPASVSMVTCWSGQSSWSWKWRSSATTCTYTRSPPTCAERRWRWWCQSSIWSDVTLPFQFPFQFHSAEHFRMFAFLVLSWNISRLISDRTIFKFSTSTTSFPPLMHICCCSEQRSTPGLLMRTSDERMKDAQKGKRRNFRGKKLGKLGRIEGRNEGIYERKRTGTEGKKKQG